MPGIITGFIAGWIIYLYSSMRDKNRRIIEYAEKNVDHVQLILHAVEIQDIESLKKIVKRDIHRSFSGNIEDGTNESKNLQGAIACCNEGIDDILTALKEIDYRKLSRADEKLQDYLLGLWNAEAEYDIAEEKRIKEYSKIIPLCILVLLLLEVIIIEISSYFVLVTH